MPIIRSYIKRITKRRPKFSASRRRILKGCVAGAAGVCLIDGFGLEPRDLRLETHDVAVPNLPPALDGFRLVQLSDFHCGNITPDSVIAAAVRIANSTVADAAVLTGDFISFSATNAKPCAKILSHLHTRLGSYAVLGNHDHAHDAPIVSRALHEAGIRVLVNDNARLEAGLVLVGLDDVMSGSPDVKSAFGATSELYCRIMLAHNPAAVHHFKDQHGLLLTGHTHGGQIRVPLLSSLLLASGGVEGRFLSGWYRIRNLLMYVNRGVGMTNLPIRFMCPPEVTLFILHATTSPTRRSRIDQ